MNIIFITIDSLSRYFMSSYGGGFSSQPHAPIERPVLTPNLDRFAAKAATFDTHYVGSLHCMPARREFFAGIQSFLWRPWGPLEPFDIHMARAVREAGYMTQLVTDHYHYFQHGSHGFYEDYNGFDFIRGHETDSWQTAPRDPDPVLLKQLNVSRKADLSYTARVNYARNVAGFTKESDFFAPKVFCSVADWLSRNQEHPNWLLAVDSFDVHEPFHCPEPYASMYTKENPHDPEMLLWPYYGRIDQGAAKMNERQVAFARAQFAGKTTMVDTWLGKMFGEMDRQKLWDNTMVVITSDHGHYLGEYGWMGKPNAPMYNTLCHTPLWIWMPGSPVMGKRVGALTSAIDIYATVLQAANAKISPHTHSRSLLPLLKGETTRHRDWALYGHWGSTMNVTDGRFTYFQPSRIDLPAYCYSTMMLNPYAVFSPPVHRSDAEAGKFLPNVEGPVWRCPDKASTRHQDVQLFDVAEDPRQLNNLAGGGVADEKRMRELMIGALKELQAPADLFARLELPY